MSTVQFRELNPKGSGYSSRISEKQWEPFRPAIEELDAQGVTHSEILTVLHHDKHEFRPSIGQLNAKMAVWGLRRYKTEMGRRYMVLDDWLKHPTDHHTIDKILRPRMLQPWIYSITFCPNVKDLVSQLLLWIRDLIQNNQQELIGVMLQCSFGFSNLEEATILLSRFLICGWHHQNSSIFHNPSRQCQRCWESPQFHYRQIVFFQRPFETFTTLAGSILNYAYYIVKPGDISTPSMYMSSVLKSLRLCDNSSGEWTPFSYFNLSLWQLESEFMTVYVGSILFASGKETQNEDEAGVSCTAEGFTTKTALDSIHGKAFTQTVGTSNFDRSPLHYLAHNKPFRTTVKADVLNVQGVDQNHQHSEPQYTVTGRRTDTISLWSFSTDSSHRRFRDLSQRNKSQSIFIGASVAPSEMSIDSGS